MSGSVVNLYKKLGETPRERLERLRIQRPHFEHEVLSYAGRLDPMAEGVMLCLVGSANHRREAYLDMSKEYTLDILFGFSTDTYDVLGKITESGEPLGIMRKKIKEALNEFRGMQAQEYPPYSSKTVEGKSLFAWAREGVMDKLSSSLKKALLLMVMERYKSDREKACRVLGISREKLETELKMCGVAR